MAKVSDKIAETLLRMEVEVITHVPGLGGTEVWEALGERGYSRPISFNEEPAVGIAHGAAVGGKRSAVIMKTQGLAKAGNALLTALSGGVQAGCVILAFHDATAQSSDNIFDAEALIKGMGYFLRFGKQGDIVNSVVAGYVESELFRFPVIVLYDANVVNEEYVEENADYFPLYDEGYYKNIERHVVCPFLADYQYKLLQRKLGKYLDELLRPQIALDSFKDKPFYATVEQYAPVMAALRTIAPDFVAGDTTLSTLYCFAPYRQIDMVSYIGGGIPLALGAKEAGFGDVWSLVGDFGFLSAGLLGIVEVLQRRLPLNILVFCNGQAAATGGQPVPTSLITDMLAAFNEHPFLRLHHIEMKDEKACEELFRQLKNSSTANIVLLHG